MQPQGGAGVGGAFVGGAFVGGTIVIGPSGGAVGGVLIGRSSAVKFANNFNVAL